MLFENDGLMGKYNRANRSLTHMIENFASVLAGLVLSGSVFPFPTFVCTCVFGVGRILHQVGYSSGYGNHGLGFMFAMLATLTTPRVRMYTYSSSVLPAQEYLPTRKNSITASSLLPSH